MNPLMRLPKLLFALALLFAVGCSSQQTAAPPPPADTTARSSRERATAEERAARQSAELATRLALDETTTAQVETILLKYARRNESLRQAGGDRRSQFGRLRENMEDQDRELKGVLTPVQYEQYEVIRDEQRARMREQMQRRRGRG
jgi:hypothetical protein